MGIRLKEKKPQGVSSLELVDLLDPTSLATFLIANIKEDMIRLGLGDSRLIDSITWRKVEKEASWLVQLIMPRYALNVNDGRRAGSRMPPVGAILEWMNRKNIRPKNGTVGNLAYAIAKSIAKRGIKPRPFLKNIPIHMEDWIDMEIKGMAREISIEVVADVKKMLIGKTQGKNLKVTATKK